MPLGRPQRKSASRSHYRAPRFSTLTAQSLTPQDSTSQADGDVVADTGVLEATESTTTQVSTSSAPSQRMGLALPLATTPHTLEVQEATRLGVQRDCPVLVQDLDYQASLSVSTTGLLGDDRSEATFASDPRPNSLDLIPLQIRQASVRILGNSDLDNMAEVDWDMADTTSTSLLQALFRRNAARCFAALLSP